MSPDKTGREAAGSRALYARARWRHDFEGKSAEWRAEYLQELLTRVALWAAEINAEIGRVE